MKKKNRKILIILIFILAIFLIIFNYFSYNTSGYNDIVKELNSKYSNNYDKILVNIDDEVKNKKYENELKLFLKIYYSYLILDYDFVFSNYQKLEKNLMKHKLKEERLTLYSIVTSMYLGISDYETAYIIIEKAEDLNKDILSKNKYFNKEKYNEHLSTMMAIKYMKIDVLCKLNLDDLADKNFKEVESIGKHLNIRNRIDIYNNKFMYYFNKGDYNNAYSTYKIIKDIPSDKNGNTDKIKIKLLTMLAILQVENNKFELAVKNANILSNLDIEIGKSTQVFILELNSYIYKHYNKLDDALDCLNDAYDIVTTLPNSYKDDATRILDSIIKIYKLKGNVPDFYYEEYIKLMENEENKSIQVILGEKLDLEIERLNNYQSLLIARSFSVICLILIITIIICIIAIKILIDNFKDGLTKVYNRKFFNLKYNKYLNQKKQFYLMIMDLDNFKSINDTYGHDFGDEVLINVSNEMKKVLVNTNSILFRYGGEEFVILTKENNKDKVLKLAEKVRSSVESMHWDKVDKVTISIGVAGSSINYTNTLKIADDNLYKPKLLGKNKVTI